MLGSPLVLEDSSVSWVFRAPGDLPEPEGWLWDGAFDYVF